MHPAADPREVHTVKICHGVSPQWSCSLLSSFVCFFLSLASCFLLLLASCLFLLPLRLELRNAGFKSTTKRAAKPPKDFLHALDSACCWCLGKFACGPWQKVTLRRAKTTWQWRMNGFRFGQSVVPSVIFWNVEKQASNLPATASKRAACKPPIDFLHALASAIFSTLWTRHAVGASNFLGKSLRDLGQKQPFGVSTMAVKDRRAPFWAVCGA